MTTHCYLVVIRREGKHYSAHCADLPDCAATGATFEEAKQRIIETMRVRVRRLQEAGLPVPESLDFEDYRYSWPEFSAENQSALGVLFTV